MYMIEFMDNNKVFTVRTDSEKEWAGTVTALIKSNIPHHTTVLG